MRSGPTRDKNECEEDMQGWWNGQGAVQQSQRATSVSCEASRAGWTSHRTATAYNFEHWHRRSCSQYTRAVAHERNSGQNTPTHTPTNGTSHCLHDTVNRPLQGSAPTSLYELYLVASRHQPCCDWRRCASAPPQPCAGTGRPVRCKDVAHACHASTV
jgi:hypothetical protein